MKANYNDAVCALVALENAGHRAFLAGGCVRDMLLGTDPNDYDVTTSATPDEVRAIFPHTVPVGESFGVVKVIHEGRELDVATFRTDGKYSDNRRPDSVTYSKDEKEDVIRRDFTINGLLCSKDREIIDYVNGQDDLEDKIIRCVGNPLDRFGEDALRMIRAIRFSVKLGFDIDMTTWKAILQLAPSIKNISKERITDELTKMFSYGHCERGFILLQTSGLWKHMFDIAMGNSDCWDAVVGLSHVQPGEPFTIPLGCIITDMIDTWKEAIIKGLVLTNAQKQELGELLQRASSLSDFMRKTLPEQRKMMQWENLDTLLRFRSYNEHVHRYRWTFFGGETEQTVLDTMKKVKYMGWPGPLITGNDLIEMGFIPGPIFSDILNRVRDVQLNGMLSTKEEVKPFILKEYSAAPRKDDKGNIIDGMRRRRIIAQCKKCHCAMSVSVEFSAQGKPQWGTAEDEINIRGISRYSRVYVECKNCHTKRSRRHFVEAVE